MQLESGFLALSVVACKREAFMIHLSEEQRLAVEQGESPLRVLDEKTNREYVLLRAETYDKLKRVLAAEEIDPSFFEFEEADE